MQSWGDGSILSLLINYETQVHIPKSRVWVYASIFLPLKVLCRNRRLFGVCWLASLANV